MLSIIRSSSSSSPFLRKGPFSRIQRLLINSETSRATESQTQKLELIADELINLTRLEQYDYAILFRHKLGFQNYGPLISGIRSPTASAEASGTGMVDAKPSAKTKFDIKLEKFDGSAKIKIIKEVRTFTDLGLKEAKDLVEKAPIVIRKGLSKEEVSLRNSRSWEPLSSWNDHIDIYLFGSL